MSLSRSVIATILFAAASAQAAVTPSPEDLCVAAAADALFMSPLTDDFPVSNERAVDTRAQAVPNNVEGTRRLLVEFAMQLRDIRYRRGGRAPATGFDCSGFVHYVFANVLGLDLPGDSAGQFSSGALVARAQMQAGDLVFFHIHGKRVSHVGIYLGEGRFIHAPTTGERVKINSLDESYWARRFAGARRQQTTA
jgi:cell wall-associated NlpC family hydrolase